MKALLKLSLAVAMSLVAPMIALAQPAASASDQAPVPAAADASTYIIGPGDVLHIFVWKNPDLSTEVPVRPDGKITAPLVQDVQAEGKTPTQLAASLHDALAAYIQEPVVTVVVKSVAAPDNEAAIRVIGAA